MPRLMTARQLAFIEMCVARTKFEVIHEMSTGGLSRDVKSYDGLLAELDLGRYGFCDDLEMTGLLVFPDDQGEPEGTGLDAAYRIVRAAIDDWLKTPVMPANEVIVAKSETSWFDDPEWVERATKEARLATASPEVFRRHLAMKLCDGACDSVARFAGLVVAWIENGKVVFATLRNDQTQTIEQEFELGELLWSEWQDVFAKWMLAPTFERLPEVTARLGRSRQRGADANE